MARRKAAAQAAPSTIEGATAMIADYIDVTLGIEELRADADQSIAAIEAARDQMIAPLEERAKDMFDQLKRWWSVAGENLTEGKRKSIELAGALIGERTTPPSLKLPKGVKAEKIVRDLLAWLAGDFIVTTHKLDKPAIIGALRGRGEPTEHDLHVLTEELKLSVGQRDEFFIDRAGSKPADPKIELEETA